MPPPTPGTPARRARDNERPLVEDIRLLGRILGDVIREQEGVAAFELVERIRKLSVAFRRDADQEADRALEDAAEVAHRRPGRQRDPRLHLFQPPGQPGRGPPPHPPARSARARGRHPGRQHRSGAGAPALGRHQPARDRRRRSPTATCRRCSPRTRPRCSARASSMPSARSRSCWPSATRSRPARCRRTRWRRASSPPTRRSCGPASCSCGRRACCASRKLTVADEIENALSYYEATFLREIPKLYAGLERELGQQPVASFLRMGMWIGGDRDGNPNVDARTLEQALRRQCEVALRHYLTEVHFLGRELSVSALLVDVTPEMRELAEPVAGPQRAPRGRALPPRPRRHVCATGRDAEGLHRRRRRAAPAAAAEPVCDGGRIPCRPVHGARLAAGRQVRRARQEPPAAADARGRGVRLPPGHHGPAADLRPARGGGRRTAGHRARGERLRGAGRARPARPAAAAAGRRAPAARDRPRLFASMPSASSPSSRPPCGCGASTAPRRSATTSSATPRR